MVIALRHVKLNDERVDPSLPVLDPLTSSAEETHWSMGGVRSKRHRLPERIEGKIKKLQAERQNFLNKTKQGAASTDQIGTSTKGSPDQDLSPSPPPAFLTLVDEGDDEDLGVGRNLARKLWDEFEEAAESNLGQSRGSPSKKLEKDSSKTIRIAENFGSSWTDCSSFVVNPSPPPAPIITKRRRRQFIVEGNYGDLDVGRKLARDLEDEFDGAAVERGLGKNRGSPLMIKNLKKVWVKSTRRRIGSSGTGTSPTWEKRGSIRAFR